MSRDHYAFRSLRRTGRQLALTGALCAIGFVVLVALLLILGTGE